jgi:hypothetical protein
MFACRPGAAAAWLSPRFQPKLISQRRISQRPTSHTPMVRQRNAQRTALDYDRRLSRRVHRIAITWKIKLKVEGTWAAFSKP